ncbi:MAG: hypothetical protein GQ470_02480 [Gammaproteobacteria bacterium]|nr:hypothetical protein [Gammaproteobacteria bacterium]
MKMRKLLAPVLLPVSVIVLVLLSAPLLAKDLNQNYVTFGKGSESCRAYTEARVEDRREMDRFRQFVYGYLTAFNLVIPKNFNILGDRILVDAFEWLDAHCAKRPDENMTNALAALTLAYYKERNSLKKDEVGSLEQADNAAENAANIELSKPQP